MTNLQVRRCIQDPLPYIVCKLQNSKEVSQSEAETHFDASLVFVACEAGSGPGYEFLVET